MTEALDYIIETDDSQRTITIIPHNEVIPGGAMYATGVYKLTEGNVGLGEIVFDELTDEWRYNGFGELTQDQLFDIVAFIHKHKHDGE
jgi:hypothetical protein